MKTKIILPFLFIVLFFSCDKDKTPSIDYNVLTEQRILEISDQATITDEDIATLERLNEQVTDNSLRAKYAEMIEGVKILKDFIPRFNQLRVDPDVIFQDLYAELQEQLKQVTDNLPRKAKLQTELETVLANYNTEEVEFLEAVLADEGRGLKYYLANNFDIHPVEGKPTKYLRSAIENVDSLVWDINITVDVEGMLAPVLQHFRGLKYLKVSSIEKVIDLNHLQKLETFELILNSLQPTGWELKIDQLPNLKNLIVKSSGTIRYSPFGEVIDFTGKYPLLERLEIPKEVAENLTSLILPDKQYLTQLIVNSVNSRLLPKIKRLVVEGKEIEAIPDFNVGSPDSEIDEIRLSGISARRLSLQGSGTFSGTSDKVKVKKLSVADVNVSVFSLLNIDVENLLLKNVSVGKRELLDDNYNPIYLINVDFPQKPDFGFIDLSKIHQLSIANITYGGKALSYTDISSFLENNKGSETLEFIDLIGVTNPPTEEQLKTLFPNLQEVTYE